MKIIIKSLLFVLLGLCVGCEKSHKITWSGGSVNIEVSEGTIPVPVPDPTPDPTPDPDPTTKTFEVNGSLVGVPVGGKADSPWYQSIDHLPAHPRSADIIAATAPVVSTIGRRTQNDWGGDFGIPYAVGSGHAPVSILYDNAVESDPGPFPIALETPIEAGGDAHLLFFDKPNGMLYELFYTSRTATGYHAGSGAKWDSTKSWNQRPLGWTSADAAGMPILPLLVTVDDVAAALAKPNPADQYIPHALRFTLTNTGRGLLPPAQHFASTVPYSLPGRPPMGMRVRVKKTMDLSIFNPPTQVIMRTLQIKGMILADNGANWFITGTQDPRWWNAYAPGSISYFDAITGVDAGKIGLKQFSRELFDSNIEVVDFKDSDVITQVP